MLSSRAFQKPSRSFDRSHSTAFGQDEFLELWTKMRSPSIGSVDDGSGSHFAARGRDSDPAIAVFVRDVQDGSVGLEVQVAFFEELLQEGVDEFVGPAVEQDCVSKANPMHRGIRRRHLIDKLTPNQQDAQQQPWHLSSARTPPPHPHPQSTYKP